MPEEPIKPKARQRQRRLGLRDKPIPELKPNGELRLVERFFKEYKVTPLKSQHRAITLIPRLQKAAETLRYNYSDLAASRRALEQSHDWTAKIDLEQDIRSAETAIAVISEEISKNKLTNMLFQLLYEPSGQETEFNRKFRLALEQHRAKLLPGTTLLLTLFNYQIELASLSQTNPKLRIISELLQEIGKEESPKQGELF